jgi:hypothetical protein
MWAAGVGITGVGAVGTDCHAVGKTDGLCFDGCMRLAVDRASQELIDCTCTDLNALHILRQGHAAGWTHCHCAHPVSSLLIERLNTGVAEDGRTAAWKAKRELCGGAIATCVETDGANGVCKEKGGHLFVCL